MRTKSRSGAQYRGQREVVDLAIARLAAGQRGIVTRRQLIEAGLTGEQIGRRLCSARLHPVHRGVYSVGHPLLVGGARELAAALACGPMAVVSHASAAHLHGLLPRPAHRTAVEITVAGADRGHRPGIRVHRTRAFGTGETGTLAGIPVTTPARTVLDLASRRPGDLERAFAEARVQSPAVDGEVETLIARYPARRGSRAIRTLLERGGPRLTQSEAERRFLALLRRARLPEPETNVSLGRYTVDVLWRDQRLAVEIDGYRYHSSRRAFERDHAKDAELRRLGIRLLRFTWMQLIGEPEATVAAVARELAPATR
jgi:very-short-patch-repair endonuclease